MPLIDPLLIQSRLGELAGRFDVDALADCDSTNSELLRRMERGAPAGTVLVADRQSAGRGRRGRSWLSSPEAGLTFSLLWRFPPNSPPPGGLSLVVGLALAETLTGLGARGLGLKWPNDVLARRGDAFAKLAGILIELAGDRRGWQAVIGIGLNLATPPGELGQAAAGLAELCDAPPDRHTLLAALLAGLLPRLDAFATTGFAGQKLAWEGYHAWQDQPVQILADDGSRRFGHCRGVDDDGSLWLETATGRERILSGDVSLRLQ